MTSQELERIANIEGRVGCYPFDARIPQRSICRPSPITAGQFIELDSNAQITPTYTTLTWQPYGC